VLQYLPSSLGDPRLLVGMETSDDAGVYQLTEDLALVQTVDFFTPVVDDPYMFGQIAAANALSDVYAMGGRPLTALNIVGFPVRKLEKRILAEILRGAADKVAEAGAVLVGGHTIDDQEPKFGMAVTGVIDPRQIRRNRGAEPGDVLVLTKPIGVGIYTTAIKRDLLSPEEIQEVTSVMAALNRTAAEAMREFDVHACTDVTGFGLLGHAYEMIKDTSVGLEIDYEKVPVLERARHLSQQGVVPGGTKANHQWLQHVVQYRTGLIKEDQWVLCDAVTSGGLLIAVPSAQAEGLLQRLHEQGVSAAAQIGRFVAAHPGHIRVI
jgi:selenide,water dikinase